MMLLRYRLRSYLFGNKIWYNREHIYGYILIQEAYVQLFTNFYHIAKPS
jgi:hypothetical protein